MEYDKAVEVLKTLLDKYSFTPEEKEALQTALGLTSLAVITKSKLKNRLQKERTQQDKKKFKW